MPSSRRYRTAALLSLTLDIDVLADMVSIGTLFAFAIVSAGTLYLRIKEPDIERPFRAPAIWFTAPMGVITAVLLMIPLPWDTWLRLIVWMSIGLVIYFLYGRKHSVLGNRPPQDSLIEAGAES